MSQAHTLISVLNLPYSKGPRQSLLVLLLVVLTITTRTLRWILRCLIGHWLCAGCSTWCWRLLTTILIMFTHVDNGFDVDVCGSRYYCGELRRCLHHGRKTAIDTSISKAVSISATIVPLSICS